MRSAFHKLPVAFPATPSSFLQSHQQLNLHPSLPKSAHTAQQRDCTAGTRCNLVPIKAFIHEALRRSRTSGTVLQTALCYLEAIRPKVLELVEKEKIGDGVHDEPDLTDRGTLRPKSGNSRLDVDSSIFYPSRCRCQQRVRRGRCHGNSMGGSSFASRI
jgi:hypothetical protein